MNVAILTFQFAHNYGALLQAYALKTYLQNHNMNAEIAHIIRIGLGLSMQSVLLQRVCHQNVEYDWRYNTLKEKNRAEFFLDL